MLPSLTNWPTTLLVATVISLAVAERVLPLRRRTTSTRARWLTNLVLSGTALVAAYLVVRPLVDALLPIARTHGLLVRLRLPPLAADLLAFVLLDVSFYYWHRLNHRLGLLWRFHNVHHLDPDLDVTTAFRFHAGEIALSAAFRALQLLLIAPSPEAFVAYTLVFQLNTIIHHANLRLPAALDRALCWFIVTPRMHGVHHSQVHEQMDSNFSSVLSCWDRLHGTFCGDIRQSELRIGVPGYSLPQDNGIVRCLLAPFRRQREYWHPARSEQRAP